MYLLFYSVVLVELLVSFHFMYLALAFWHGSGSFHVMVAPQVHQLKHFSFICVEFIHIFPDLYGLNCACRQNAGVL